MSSLRTISLSVLGLGLAPLAAALPVQIQDLGSNFMQGARALRISNDGQVVAGDLSPNQNNQRAFRWTAAGGIETLNSLNDSLTRLRDLSDDGSFAAGRSNVDALRWRPDGSAEVVVFGNGSDPARATNISGDGQTVVGFQGPNITGRVFVWSAASGAVFINGLDLAIAAAVSTDGSVVFGTSTNPPSDPERSAFVWTPSQGATSFRPAGFFRAEMTGASADGSVAVGTAFSDGSGSVPAGGQPFRWTAATGAVPFGPGPDPAVTPGNLNAGVSSDGSTIFGGTATGAFTWTAAAGYQLQVSEAGARFLVGSADGSTFYGQTDVGSPFSGVPFSWSASTGVVELPQFNSSSKLFDASADGSFAVGTSRIPNGTGFINNRAVRWSLDGAIGESYCGPAVANSVSASGASLSLSGSNALSFGELELNAVDLPPGSFGYFIGATSEGFVANPGGSQGNLCLGGGLFRFTGPGQIQQAGPNGELSITIDPLSDINLGGPVPSFDETFSFQGWYRDVNPTSTSNFTNGARVTLF